MDAARLWVARFNTACLAASCTLIGVVTVLTLWEVITRYAFRQPAMWTFPITSYMLLFIVMLAAPYTLQTGGHVSVEVVVEMLPAKIQLWTQRVSHLLGMAFILVFLYEGILYTQRVLRDAERDTSVLSVPLWVPAFVLVFGLAAMAVTYVFVLHETFTATAVAEEAEREHRISLDLD